MAKYEAYRETGDSEFDFVSFPLICFKVDYAFDDLNASFEYVIPIEANHMVLGVAHEVTTVFSGGTPALDIGDGTDADYWIVDTEMDMTSSGNFFTSFGSAQPGQAGAKFNTSGKVVLTHVTGLTQGEGTAYVFMLNFSGNWRTPW
jgi:hypothetical protein